MSEEWNEMTQPTEQPAEAPVEAPVEVPAEAPAEASVETPVEAPAEQPSEPTPPSYQPPSSVPPRYTQYTPYQPQQPQQPQQPSYEPSVPPVPPKKKSGNTWWIVLVSVLGALSVLAVAFSLGQWGTNLPEGLSSIGSTTTSSTTAPTKNETAPTIRYDEYEDPNPAALSTVEIVQRNLDATVVINVYSGESTDMFGYDKLAGQGSGIVWSEDGYIITNQHVVVNESTGEPYSRVEVEFYNGTVYSSATVVGHDVDTDLAVLKIEPQEGHTLTVVEFGRSDQMLLGERVVTIGASGGLAWSVSEGILSGKDRDVYEETGYDIKCLQVDATINPGNSGGPLFNALGQLVGINSAKIVLTGYENLGFSIPITEAQGVLEDLATYGKVRGRITLGIRGGDVSSGSIKGFMIQSIDEDSCFQGTNVQVNDIISGVDGVKTATRAEMRKQLSQYKAGDQVTLTVIRVKREGYGIYSQYKAEEYTVRITLKEN